MADPVDLTVVIPTYRRDDVLVETVDRVLGLDPPPAEVLVVDQTPEHAPAARARLREWDDAGRIRWLRLERPSIPHAMNVALLEAKHPRVLFLDDDVIPGQGLAGAHARHHDVEAVAGQVLQPGEEPEPLDGPAFEFRSSLPAEPGEFMAGNVSLDRRAALALGGFDENFVGAAYRFEADFAERLLRSGGRIVYEPGASIRHLRAERGGTRAYGHHLTTSRPGHTVGAYYHLLTTRTPGRLRKIILRPLRAVRTRHHLRRPWWIVPSLVAEVTGFAWALALAARGPRRLDRGAPATGHRPEEVP